MRLPWPTKITAQDPVFKYRERSLWLLHQTPKTIGELPHFVVPIQQQSYNQEPDQEPQLLILEPEIGRGRSRPPHRLKVPPAHDCLVEDVGLHEEAGLTGPLVLAVEELPDSVGDLTDLPAAKAFSDELPTAALLEPPEASIRLERLAEVEEVERATGAERQVADEGEFAVGILHEGMELGECIGGSAAVVVDGHGQGVEVEGLAMATIARQATTSGTVFVCQKRQLHVQMHRGAR